MRLFGKLIQSIRESTQAYSRYRLIFLVTGFIYISIGTEIHRKRKQLRNMTSQSVPTVQSLKTTEVHVVSETMDAFHGADESRPKNDNFSQGRRFAQYETNISSAKMSSSDAAAWAYTKCAMLFFAALIITWVGPRSSALTLTMIYLMIRFVGPLDNQPSLHPCRCR